MGKIPALPSIVIDTREQAPYCFRDSVRKGLATGDYSLLGCESEVAIERKSVDDAYSSVGQGRERFEREWQRLSKLRYGAVVVESSLSGFLVPPTRSGMRPRAVIQTYLGWSVKYRVPVFFTCTRRHSAATVQSLLTHFWRYKCEGILDTRV